MRAFSRTTPLFLLTCAAAACARSPETEAFVATLGSQDTVAVEQYTRSGDHLIGTSVAAYPRVSVRTYDVTFGPDGAVQHVHLTLGAPGTDPGTVADFTYTGDSVHVEVHRDTTTQRLSVASEGDRPLPFFEDLFAFWELSLDHAMESGADSSTFGALSGSQIYPISVMRRADSVVDIGFPQWGTVHAFMGEHGLNGLDMTATTSKYMVERVPSVDVDARAAAWAQRPQPGQLSPRDTTQAQIGGATVTVDYGRPSMRGRTVFGGIVPWNEVWRLGANAATQLITDRDLVVGDTTVPAGTYSLWVIPGESDWTLIINKQHGQWGTEYDASQDLARVPVEVTSLDAPVEQLTLTVAADGTRSGTLSMEWATTRATAAFTVR